MANKPFAAHTMRRVVLPSDGQLLGATDVGEILFYGGFLEILPYRNLMIVNVLHSYQEKKRGNL